MNAANQATYIRNLLNNKLIIIPIITHIYRLEGGSGGGDSEVQRTMLELLNQLDGFEAHQNIKVCLYIIILINICFKT